MTSPSPTAALDRRNLALDGLRGVAVGMILIQHYYLQVGIISSWHGHTWIKRLLGATPAGVELFFVISGFLIGSILLRSSEATNLIRVFYLRRFCRTLPAYGLLLILFHLARASSALNFPATANEFRATIPDWSYALLVQNIMIATTRDIGAFWLAVTWSLAVEEQFYLLIPWLVRLFRARGLLILAGLSLILCPLFRYVLSTTFDNIPGAVYLLPARVDVLFFGVALSVVWQRTEAVSRLQKFRGGLGWGVVFFGAVWVAIPFAPEGFWRIATTVEGLGCLVVVLYVLVAPDSWFSRALQHPFWLFLGGISYFIYLFHLPFLYTLHALVRRDQPLHFHTVDWLTTVVSLLLLLAAGAVSRRFIEQPFIRLGHRLRYRFSSAHA